MVNITGGLYIYLEMDIPLFFSVETNTTSFILFSQQQQPCEEGSQPMVIQGASMLRTVSSHIIYLQLSKLFGHISVV